jgi:hypothetical protein
MNGQRAIDAIPSHIRHHLLSHPRSGLSVQRYCEKNSISTWSFYQWRKRYQSKLTLSTGNRISFTELGILENAGCVCDIRFPSGVSVAVRRGISHEELAGILELVQAQKPC